MRPQIDLLCCARCGSCIHLGDAWHQLLCVPGWCVRRLARC